ncbi:Plasmodium vivax Vir protein, putative [Plasmodium vivax]|nr:Plasmodium vivax Vir protein, putative [Plasmodium vivax]
MRKTFYNTAKTFLTYTKILEEWDQGYVKVDSEKCFGFSQKFINQYNNTFTDKDFSQALHYLNTVDSTNESQYISDACKYFMYWLYYYVLKNVSDKHNISKIYEDVLTGYIDRSDNENFRNYVSSFSEKTIDKIIKLAEIYDNSHKFKGDIKHQDKSKCDHAEECVRLYKKNIEVCEEDNDSDFCYELDNLKESYDTYMKSNESFPNSPKTLESYRLFNPTVVIITPFSILLVISLSLFFLYKFTPFGSFFQKGTKNKKKIPGNVDYEMQVPSHASQRVNKYNKNRQYNISYLSSGQ